MIDQQLGRETVRLVEQWTPNERYDHERKFQSELQGYLQRELEGGGMLGENGHHDVSTERGKSRGDVVVDDRIGIELKRDFSNGQEKKLVGQLDAYQREYEHVIACACGIDDIDGWKRVQKEAGSGIGGMTDPNSAPIEFVHIPVSRMGGNDREHGAETASDGSPAVANSASASLDGDELGQMIEEGVRGIRALTSNTDSEMATGDAVMAVIRFVILLTVMLTIAVYLVQALIL